MKRGEIYYIHMRPTVGAEINKARPGVIVSNDALNQTSDVVEVVYLTTQPKKALPTHTVIDATGVESTVLCEQIDTVSIQLVGDYCGACSEEEMAAIEHGLLASLDLGPEVLKTATRLSRSVMQNTTNHDPVSHPSHYTDGKIEVIDFIEDKKLSFHLGNAVKYIARAGKKDPTKKVEDLRKAAWYIQRELDRLTKEGAL